MKALVKKDKNKTGEYGKENISDLVFMKATNVEVHQAALHENKLLAQQHMLLLIAKEVEKRTNIVKWRPACRW